MRKSSSLGVCQLRRPLVRDTKRVSYGSLVPLLFLPSFLPTSRTTSEIEKKQLKFFLLNRYSFSKMICSGKVKVLWRKQLLLFRKEVTVRDIQPRFSTSLYGGMILRERAARFRLLADKIIEIHPLSDVTKSYKLTVLIIRWIRFPWLSDDNLWQCID